MQYIGRDAILRDIIDELLSAAINSTTATASADTTAQHAPVDAVALPTKPKSSITALKGVDHACDREFGLEALEADGPADSWLLNADLSSAGAVEAARERNFCKGPSWERFVERMKGQQGAAGNDATTAANAQQEPPAAAGLPAASARSSSSSTGAPSSAEAKPSGSITLRRQSSKQNNSQTPSRSASGKLPSPSVVSGAAHASPSQVATADVAAGSPLLPSGRISRSGSLQKTNSRAVPSSQHETTSTVAAAAPAATDPAEQLLQTPVRNVSSSGGGAAQEAENAVWMASLRKGGASNSSSRRVSRTQSAGGASPHTPVRSNSKLTHSRSARMSAPGVAPGSPATPASASSSRASSSKKLPVHPTAAAKGAHTPPTGSRNSSSKGLSQAAKGRATPVSISRSGSGKYSLRRSRPGTPTGGQGSGSIEFKLDSHPTSPVISPRGKSSPRGKTSPRRSGAGAYAAAAAAGKKAASGGQKAASSGGKGTRAAASPRSPKAPASAAAAKERSSKNTKQHTELQPSSMNAEAATEMTEAQTAAEAAAAAAERLNRAARITADVPLPKGTSKQDESWATDPAAVELFMDEYKDAIDAVDDAYTGTGSSNVGKSSSMVQKLDDSHEAAGPAGAVATGLPPAADSVAAEAVDLPKAATSPRAAPVAAPAAVTVAQALGFFPGALLQQAAPLVLLHALPAAAAAATTQALQAAENAFAAAAVSPGRKSNDGTAAVHRRSSDNTAPLSPAAGGAGTGSTGSAGKAAVAPASQAATEIAPAPTGTTEAAVFPARPAEQQLQKQLQEDTEALGEPDVVPACGCRCTIM